MFIISNQKWIFHHLFDRDSVKFNDLLLTLTSKFLQQIARFQLSRGVTDTKSRIAAHLHTGAYSTWEREDATSASYCPAAAFLTAFVGLICFWVLLPLCCVALCCVACTACWCACCCVRCCAKEAEVGTTIT